MTFNVKIERVVNQGYSIGFYEDKTVFVAGALPDELLKVSLLYTKKRSLFCEIVEVIEPSSFRGETRCEASGCCGACEWVNVEYPKQIQLKTDIYNGLFASHRQSLTVKKSPQIDHYRNKCFFPVQERDGEFITGMYARNSHNIVQHSHCLLYPPIYQRILQRVIAILKEVGEQPYNERTKKGNIRHIGIRGSSKQRQLLVFIVTKKTTLLQPDTLASELKRGFPQIVGIVHNIQPKPDNVIMGNNSRLVYGHGYFNDRLCGRRLRIYGNAFYQLNTRQAEIIYTSMKAHLHSEDVVLDAYSGIGTIAFCIHQSVKKVVCIEEDAKGHKANIYNQRLLKTENITAINQKTEDAIEPVLNEHNINVVIFDPPRKGLEKSIIDIVVSHKIPKVLYLSCDCATQKRDLQLFETAGYKVISLQGYDMFPHTWHVESLAVLGFRG